MTWLDVTRIIIFYAFFPLVFLLKLVFAILRVVTAPFIYLATLIGYIISLPWRVIAKFEVPALTKVDPLSPLLTMIQALWYFLSVAVVLGVFSALLIHFILRGCIFLLKLDRQSPPPDVPAKGHDAISYRAARLEKKRKQEERNEDKAKYWASQPLIQEIVREARNFPITGPTGVLRSPNPGVLAARSGLFSETILEHSDEDDDSTL